MPGEHQPSMSLVIPGSYSQNQHLFIIWKIHRLLKNHHSQQIYKTMFVALIKYGDVLYDGVKKSASMNCNVGKTSV